jgi:hypothetical protein
MATSFSTIYDQFMMFVTDYKLINLYNSSVPNFETYLQGFLIPAITDFKNCDQSLSYATSSFTETLTEKNVKILALLMKRYWLTKEIDDIKQMNLHVTDKDFKIFAESNNMLAKQKRLVLEQEELSQVLVDYGLDVVDWSAWFNGVFYVP